MMKYPQWVQVPIYSFMRVFPISIGKRLHGILRRTLRLFGNEMIGTAYWGAHFICDQDDLIQGRILHFGVWEREVSKTIEGHLFPGACFVDAGANIGYDTLLASHCVGPKGKVIAIEASPTIAGLLKRNLSLNSASNVKVVNKALAATAGPITLYKGLEKNIGQTTAVFSENRQVDAVVEGLPFSDIFDKNEKSQINVIKIDVEGSEGVVLNSIIDNIDDYKDLYAMLVEVSTDMDSIISKFKDNGFDILMISNVYGIEDYIKNTPAPPMGAYETWRGEQVDILMLRRNVFARVKQAAATA